MFYIILHKPDKEKGYHMNKYIVDRFEGCYAVCEKEDKSFINIKKDILPPDTKEGDILIENNGDFYIDTEATEARKQLIRKKLDSLFE